MNQFAASEARNEAIAADARKLTRTIVCGVLAGAYRGRDISERALLTHVFVVTPGAPDRVLCHRVPVENLCYDQPLDTPPTCPECAKRFAKPIVGEGWEFQGNSGAWHAAIVEHVGRKFFSYRFIGGRTTYETHIGNPSWRRLSAERIKELET
jgi:hypothetical protein